MRERPDNDMTRKLRPLHSEEEPDGHTGNEDSANASPSAGDDFQDGPPGKQISASLLQDQKPTIALLAAPHAKALCMFKTSSYGGHYT